MGQQPSRGYGKLRPLPLLRSVLLVFAVLALVGNGVVAGSVLLDIQGATADIGRADSQSAPAAAPAPVLVAARTLSCPTLSAVDPPWMVALPLPPPLHQAVEVPRSLERRSGFWTRVWGERGDDQHFLVDQRRPWIVHAEVDCRDVRANKSDAAAAKDECGARLTTARRVQQTSLKTSWSRPATLKLYDGNRALAHSAADNIMAIQGRKDALARAIDRAAPHLGHAEGLFALEDVPRIYARAAIVESLWRPGAFSRAGAAGAYQFMATTGRQFLAVKEGVVDERLDPLRASWAAARYLSQMAKSLQKWPLVLTAYNTGPARLKRVIKERHTRDIGKIADAGDLGDFGFDGQNYYAQIAAIARLTQDALFEPVPITGRAVRVDSPISFGDLASCVEATREALARANPALADAVLDGTKDVPAGYVAHVPAVTVQTASLERTSNVAQR